MRDENADGSYLIIVTEVTKKRKKEDDQNRLCSEGGLEIEVCWTGMDFYPRQRKRGEGEGEGESFCL